jgi:hypothetical protein
MEILPRPAVDKFVDYVDENKNNCEKNDGKNA